MAVICSGSGRLLFRLCCSPQQHVLVECGVPLQQCLCPFLRCKLHAPWCPQVSRVPFSRSWSAQVCSPGSYLIRPHSSQRYLMPGAMGEAILGDAPKRHTSEWLPLSWSVHTCLCTPYTCGHEACGYVFAICSLPSVSLNTVRVPNALCLFKVPVRQ